MTINPYFDFVSRGVSDPKQALLVWDVDLAIQNSMCTETTPDQRAHMWELFERTDGGVLIMTGRTHQSAEKTFGKQYAGVYEHGSIARYGHGHSITWLAPEIDSTDMGARAYDAISQEGSIRIAATPDEIRKNSFVGSTNRSVFIEIKNASIALVHTTNGDHNHLDSMRKVLEPLGQQILENMGLDKTHKVKAGSDAVELVPNGAAPDHKAGIYLNQTEINRIAEHGLSKETAVHNFQTLYAGRRILFTGDSKPDIDAMIVAKEHHGGTGVFVSNGHSLNEIYNGNTGLVDRATAAVSHTTPHFTMTWPLIGDTVKRLRDQAPITVVTPANTESAMGRPNKRDEGDAPHVQGPM